MSMSYKTSWVNLVEDVNTWLKVKALMGQHKMEQTVTLESLYVGFVNLEPESYQFKKTIWNLVT
jgi:hypothetical protein